VEWYHRLRLHNWFITNNRTHREITIIDGDYRDLGVNHGGFIFIDISFGLEQIAVSASSRAARQSVIVMFAWNNNSLRMLPSGRKYGVVM